MTKKEAKKLRPGDKIVYLGQESGSLLDKEIIATQRFHGGYLKPFEVFKDGVSFITLTGEVYSLGLSLIELYKEPQLIEEEDSVGKEINFIE